jgi:hypothetical protein
MKPESENKTTTIFPAWRAYLIFLLIILTIEDLYHITQINQAFADLEGHSAGYKFGYLFGIVIKPLAHGYLAFFLFKKKRFWSRNFDASGNTSEKTE